MTQAKFETTDKEAATTAAPAATSSEAVPSKISRQNSEPARTPLGKSPLKYRMRSETDVKDIPPNESTYKGVLKALSNDPGNNQEPPRTPRLESPRAKDMRDAGKEMPQVECPSPRLIKLAAQHRSFPGLRDSGELKKAIIEEVQDEESSTEESPSNNNNP
ncbi:MAG: hypothetical protein EPN84_05050 [Legionella sp.]|nr:MAG: hypothetical protein EPN84_05050 [Legionella sp.]